MEMIKKYYDNLSELKKNIVCSIAVIALIVAQFFALKYILLGISAERDPENPRAYFEKVLREFK